jgi:hypothetical protein
MSIDAKPNGQGSPTAHKTRQSAKHSTKPHRKIEQQRPLGPPCSPVGPHGSPTTTTVESQATSICLYIC